MHYRKIWTQANGPIPRDEEGHSYEIHHKDGNRKNNNIDNLLCITIQEHYDIHYIQGDYAAAFRIAQRMNLDPEVKSELMSRSNKKRLQEGNHPFIDMEVRDKAKSTILDKVKKGLLPFQDKEFLKKALQIKQEKYTHEELSEQTKKGWEKWKQNNPDTLSRTLPGSQAGAQKTKGTKWYHKLTGEQLRTTEDDPRIEKEQWVKGRFNGKELSANANFRKLNKHKNS